ncbi:MAG: phytoene/squalene synthase family protein [Candidatus Phaeomarinobacter sp.]
MDDVVAEARTTIQQGSKSFAGAAALFGRDMRESAYMLYAWCRYCDDVIDGQELGFAKAEEDKSDPQARFEMLLQRTRAAYRGETVNDPVFTSFQRVVQKHNVPEQYPLDLLRGFHMDVAEHTYATPADTLTYGYYVAGAVGVMMAMVMGVRDENILDRACDLGIGFQLTNISRDIIDDAKIERIYLPQSWLEEEEIPYTTAAILDPANRPAIARVARRLVSEAEPYYTSSLHGIAHLPFRAAWAIATARRIYRRIGMEVLAKGEKAWDDRTGTSTAQKISYAVLGLGDAVISRFRKSTAGPSRAGLWTRATDLSPIG